MHDAEFDHEHLEESALARQQASDFIWSQEHIRLRTVGIDIGSSTTHLLFAEVLMQREPHGLSSRFRPVRREVVWRSPIMLTPFESSGTIDIDALRSFIERSYADAGMRRDEIDSGAVILTGEAIKRKNARLIDHALAAEAGTFVCATAGHELECRLAAYGSGAIALSRERRARVVNIDIGGGTTKLALIDKGGIAAVAAFAVGGRILATGADGRWTYVTDAARILARELELSATPKTFADAANRRRIAERLARVVLDNLQAPVLDPLAQDLALTAPLARPVDVDFVTVSGGVAEYVFGRETARFGDIAPELAAALSAGFAERLGVPAVDPGQGIRATVIGASQHTVQVSGKTTYLPDPSLLPARNIPVLVAASCDPEDSATIAKSIREQMQQIEFDTASWLAISATWRGSPEYERLRHFAEGILSGIGWKRTSRNVLIVVIEGDVARSLGHILADELGCPWRLVVIDGVELREFDYVDLGERLDPPGVIPVVIKSLVFASAV